MTPWSAACQASLSITNSRSLLKLMSIESVMPSNHLIFCHPLLLLPSVCPSIRVSSPPSSPRMMESVPLCIASTWLIKPRAEKDSGCHDESMSLPGMLEGMWQRVCQVCFHLWSSLTYYVEWLFSVPEERDRGSIFWLLSSLSDQKGVSNLPCPNMNTRHAPVSHPCTIFPI